MWNSTLQSWPWLWIISIDWELYIETWSQRSKVLFPICIYAIYITFEDFFPLTYCVCMCDHVHVYAMTCIWRSEDNLLGVFSPSVCGSQISVCQSWLQVPTCLPILIHIYGTVFKLKYILSYFIKHLQILKFWCMM